MAVSAAQLATYLGLDAPDTAQTEELDGILGAAGAIVQKDAPDAPEAVKDLAIRRWSAYVHDQPFAARGQSFSNAMVNSGAGSILGRWVVRRLAEE